MVAHQEVIGLTGYEYIISAGKTRVVYKTAMIQKFPVRTSEVLRVPMVKYVNK